jgi:hypothetical protein
MKKLIMILFFSFPVFLTSFSQQNSLRIEKYYHTWVISKLPDIGKKRFQSQPKKTIYGVLFDVKDSSLLMTNYVKKEDLARSNYTISEVSASNIQKVILKQQGTRSLGKMVGGLAGFGIGVTVSVVIIPWEDTDFLLSKIFAVVGTTAMTAAFTIAGVGIGSLIDNTSKIRIPVEGSQEKFDISKERLRTYSLKYMYREINDHPIVFSKLRDTIYDIDGNLYRTVALGAQVWMTENLKVKHFRDGSEIDRTKILKTGIEQRYEWNTTNDKRGLCPAGWHVPSSDEWNSLIQSLGNFEPGWKMENGFAPRGVISHWWSSTGYDDGNAWSTYLDNKTTGIMINGSEKISFLSVRCLRDY